MSEENLMLRSSRQGIPTIGKFCSVLFTFAFQSMWMNIVSTLMPRLKPELKGALLTLVALVLLLIGIWVWIGIRIGIWTYPQYDRHVWLVETIPFSHMLWSHQVNAGDSAYELIDEWPPDEMTRFGPWIDMQWLPGGLGDGFSYIGVSVIAKDGVLVQACAYSDDGLNDRMFFNTWTTNDENAFYAAERAHTERLQAENELLYADLPILKENIKAGDNAENIIRLWHPAMITRFGHWTILRWFPENPSLATKRVFCLRLIAKNGILVYANSFSDDGHNSVYFDTETQQDKEDFDSANAQSLADKIQNGTKPTN